MSTYNPARYRYVDWIAGRILEATELDRLQKNLQGVASDNTTPWVWDLGAVYEEGSTLNVTPAIAGRTVTLTATDGSKPMLVFARGRWEILQVLEAPAVTLTSGQTNLYLNWQLTVRDNTVDTTLVDAITNQPTAKMGEMGMQVSAVDSSTVTLNTALYFQQNPAPIVLFTFTGTSTLAVAGFAGVKAQALASASKAGLVSLTTATSAGRALAADDAVTSNSRNPNPLSVTDAAVRVPVMNGANTYPIGTGGGQDAGGISTAKLVHVPTNQLGSTVIEGIRAQGNSTAATLAAHAGSPLAGSSAAAGALPHPLPTPADIQAAPQTHVGRSLDPGFATSALSHPAQVNVNIGGFVVAHAGNGPVVINAPDTAPDAGFGVFDLARVLQAGLLNNGDVYSLLAQNLAMAAPLQEASDTASGITMASGALGAMSMLATVLGQHVNKVSHKNPHGITLPDLGLTISYNFVANSGYIKFAMGANVFMIQWGTMASVGNGAPGSSFSFIPQFPNNCFGAYGVAVCPQGFDSGFFVLSGTPSPYGFTAYVGGQPDSRTVYWFAIGN